MRKKQLVVLMGLITLMTLAGCGEAFKAPEPSHTPPPAMPEVPVSHIRVALTLPVDVLARDLSRLTADKIMETEDQKVKCGIGKCRLSLLATRTGPVQLSGAAGQADSLHLVLPFDARARLRMPGMFSSVKAKAHGAGEIEVASRLRLDPDGRLRAESDGVVRLDGGNLRMGPVRTDLAHLWNANAEQLSRPLFRTLDREIARHVDTRGALEKVWRQGFRPIRIGRHPLMWLQFRPENLLVGTLTVTDKTISLPVGLDMRASLLIRPDPPEVKPVALPALQPYSGTDDSYAVYLPVVLPYDRAEALALRALQAHPPHVGGFRVHILNLHIQPSGQDIIVRTQFCASPRWDVLNLFSACGTVYFRGVPEYDAKDRQIRVRNFKYDLESENLLLTQAHRLAGPELARTLQRHCRFDLAKDIDRLHEKVAGALAAGARAGARAGAGAGESVHIDGTLTVFAPVSLSWTEKGFVAVIAAKGKTNVQLRP